MYLDVDGRDGLEDRLRQPRPGQVDPPVLQQTVQGVPHGGGLLMDLFEHEVLVSALFRCLGVPGDLGQGKLHLVSIEVVKMDLPRAESCRLLIADVVHISRVVQDGGHIRGQIGPPLRHAEDHGRVLPGGEDLAGIVLKHQRQGIGPLYAHHGPGEGVHRAQLVFFVVVVHQLHRRFGVGV